MATKDTSQPSTNKFKLWTLRSITALLLAISCLGVVAYTSVHWVERQILNTDNWVTFVTPLPKEPAVSKALGSYITDQLFSNVPVEQKVTEALPPKASFLAQPLTSELNKLTNQITVKAVSSDAFQTVWVAANRAAMNHLLTTARATEDGSQPTTQNQRFHLDLNNSKGIVRQKLGTIAPALFSDVQTNQKDVSVDTNLKAKPERLRQYVRAMDYLNAVLPTLIIAGLLGALALSRNRRRLMSIFAGSTIGLALLQLIGLKALRPEVLNQVQNNYRPAVAAIYDPLVKSFNHGVFMTIALSLLILLICLLAGKAKWAISFRGLLRVDKISGSKFMAKWRAFRAWIKPRKYYFWLGLVALALVYLAFIATVNARSVTNTTLASLGLIAAVQIIASSPRLGHAKHEHS